MSSTYRVLCLSHDPAIAVGDYGSAEEAADAMTIGIDDHAHCDLLVGRYSYPLVEVGCPPNIKPRRPGQACRHSVTEWVDAAWLRLLAAAYQSGDGQMRALACAHDYQHCWPWGRLLRLHVELGFVLREDPENEP